MVENPSKKSYFEPFKHKYWSECKKLLKDELHLCCRAKMDTNKLSNCKKNSNEKILVIFEHCEEKS